MEDQGDNEMPLLEQPILQDLPQFFDARSKWLSCKSIQTISDQGACGSCWAISATAVLSDRVCITYGRNRRISSEDLLTCCGIGCGQGCDGGYPSGAWKYFKNKGVVTGNEYGNNNLCRPYSFPPCNHYTKGTHNDCESEIFLFRNTPPCVAQCTSQSGLIYEQDKTFVKSFYQVPKSEEAIRNEIYQNGPVQATFQVYEDFLTYRSGVYQHVVGNLLGGHAVKIIGWGQENGVQYWLVVNSWNEEWGEYGTFKILRGTDHVGIESQVYAGLVGSIPQ